MNSANGSEQREKNTQKIYLDENNNTHDLEKQAHINKPEDVNNYLYHLFFLFMGMVALTPFNCIMTPGGFLYRVYNNYFGAIMWITSIPNVIFIILLIKISKSVSFKKRIIISWGSQIILIITQSLIPEITNYPFKEMNTYFIISIVLFDINTFLSTFFFAISQGSIFGLAGCFPSKYIKDVATGTSLSGLIMTSVYFCLNQALDINTQRKIIFTIFYGFGCLIMMGGILSYLLFSKTVFFKLHIKDNQQKSDSIENRESKLSLKENFKIFLDESKLVIKKIWKMMFCVWMIMFTTFTIFPTILFGLKCSGDECNSYFGLLLLFVFASFDVLGRFTSYFNIGFLNVIFAQKRMLMSVIIRFVLLIPLVLVIYFCQRGYFGEKMLINRFMDILLPIIYGLTSFTLGCMLNVVIYYGVKDLDNCRESEVGSMYMTFFLCLGIFCGQLLAFIITL